MKRVLKIVANPWGAATRDRRELAIARELGAEVVVMVKGNAKDKGRHESMHGYDTYGYSTRPLGTNRLLAPINRIVSLFTWACYARRYKADVISGHDYIALFIGYLSTLFVPKERKPLLVYDAHELEVGRNKKRSKMALFIVKRIEGFLIHRCAFSIVVSDYIADELKRMYKLKNRPIVARSIPTNWAIDSTIIEATRMQLCEKLNITNNGFILMFHGAVLPNRGIENIVDTVAEDENVHCVILGNALDNSYDESLAAHIAASGASDRILRLQAVEHSELWKYVGAADAEILIMPNTCNSYYHMLPNKFFESIQTLTPLIYNEFPDVSEIIHKYDIGITVNSENRSEVIAAIEKLRTDEKMYARFKENLAVAKAQLSWETEKRELTEAYRRVLGDCE